jgi:hypothetical protein
MLRATALLALAATACQEDFFANSYRGKAPPELAGEAAHWINSKEALTFSALKGKVVWLEFSFIN